MHNNFLIEENEKIYWCKYTKKPKKVNMNNKTLLNNNRTS